RIAIREAFAIEVQLVDCAKAHKGLFCGIFLLVVCIISLILFFVLIKKPNYRHLGVLQAHIVELAIYTITAIACILAIIQVRELKYNRHHNIELDNILLIVAQTGLYIFNMFSLIGAFFFLNKQSESTQLVLINAIACLVQATLQSVFILDASRRYAATSSQVRRKPGRESVTFLLVTNFAMWAINTLETRRADSNPVQMHFYGFWAWTIITHVTAPLTIFFRFHSTVCLCDIWKRTYKMKI
ncbi:otopetrin-2-like protein 1, partial [Leptotrombidium deliense]